MTFPWKNTRRYFSFSDYLRERYGCRVQKVSLHAGFTCPNRDGRVAFGGCTYCINESFNPQAGKPQMSIREQMKAGMAYMKRRYRAEKFIAYFQAFSNTYADPDVLKARYDEALEFEDVVGLSIGTRPDCVPDRVLDLIEDYARHKEVWLEYGLQSAKDTTLALVNRGHDYAAFEDAIHRTRGRGIKICVHVILGLPGESREDMMDTAQACARLHLDGVKLHHLYVARGAAMEQMYARGDVRTLQPEEYVSLCADFLERTPEHVAVQRLVGDTRGALLIAPIWDVSKSRVLRMLTEEFERRGTHQGSLCSRTVAAIKA